MDQLFDKIIRYFQRRRNKTGSIHLWYPDILHWQQGDKVNCWNIALAANNDVDMGDIQRFRDPKLGTMIGDFTYKSVDDAGHIFLEDREGNLMQFDFWRLVKYAKNISLKNRNLETKLKDSAAYMELTEHFQQAFNELQEADNHPKRIGNSNQQTNERTKLH